jgi:ABC-2 type transport system permease protein
MAERALLPDRLLPAWAIVERDLRKYFRSPALLFASLFMPLLQLVIIGYAFGGKIKDVAVALVDLDRGPEALALREKFEAVEANARTFKVHLADSLETALRDTREGRVGATIVIPEQYSQRVGQRLRPELGLVLDNTDPFVVATLTQKMGEVLDAVNRPEVAVRYNRQVGLEVVEIFPYVEYVQYLLPGAITLAIFMCVLLGGGILYIDDKVRGIHEAYLVTPISKVELVMGMHFSGVIKGAFAGLVVMLVGVALSGIIQVLTPGTLIVLVSFAVLVSSALVSMVSLLMVRVDDPLVPRVVIGLLNTLLFFPSGAVYPISSFPRWLQLVAKVDPFTYAVHGFRSLLLKDIGPTAVLADIAVLSALSTACLAGVLLIFRRRL